MLAQPDHLPPVDTASGRSAAAWRCRTVAITGGAGFVAAELVRELVRQGSRVLALDVAPFDRLADLTGHPRLRCCFADVRDAGAMRLHLQGCDVVLHLAAVVGVQRYIADPGAVIDVNLNGTRAVADACRHHGCALLLASTSEVYGTMAVDLREDAPVQLGNLHNPRWSYALSKASAEQVVLAHARAGLRAAVVRYFNVYGPELDAPGQGRVLSQFLGQLLAGKPLHLVDGGAAVRSLCYIDDAVQATLLLVDRLAGENASGGAPVVGEIVNVGRKEPVTMAELAGHVLRLSGRAVGTVDVAGDLQFGQGFEEIPRRVPVLEKLERLTGFVAATTLECGLRNTLGHWGLLSPGAPPAAPRSVAFVAPDLVADGTLLARCAQVLVSGRLSNRGSEVEALERELAAAIGVKQIVAVSSGYAALVLALHLTRPRDVRRDVVLLPSFTFAATRNAVLAAGLRPVYVDVDPGDWTLDAEAVERELAGRSDVAAILPVTVFGVPPDLAALRRLADTHACALVLDDAHGLGTLAAGTSRDPALCDARALSLHATKMVVAGEGGALVAHNEAVLEAARELANHGIRGEGRLHATGWNFKLPELAAVTARHSLRSLAARLQRRRRFAAQLRQVLGQDAALAVQEVPIDVQSNCQNFGTVVRDRSEGVRDAYLEQLRAAGVQARSYFWPGLHPALNGSRARAVPVAASLEKRILCLPLHDGLTDDDIKTIDAAVQRLHHPEQPWPRLNALP